MNLTNTSLSDTTDTPLSNACVPIADLYPQDLIGRLDVRISFGVVYFIIFFIGLVGNLLVLYGLLKHGMSFQGIRPEYILSLTCADVLIICTSLPINGVQTFVREWIFGSFACRVIPILQGMGVFATSFTMVAIAIDRYRCIVLSPMTAIKRAASFRFGDDLEKHKHWPKVAFIWVLSIALSAPYGIFLIYRQYSRQPYRRRLRDVCGHFCAEKWPKPGLKCAYGFTVFILQFLLPLLICIFCYAKVYQTVKNQTIARASHERLSNVTKAKIRHRRRRILLLACLMLACFMLSWLPMNVLNLMRDFKLLGDIIPASKFAFIFAVAHCFAMSSVFWDPIIYSFCNPQFRELICISRQEGIRRRSTRGTVMRTRICGNHQSLNSSLEDLTQNGGFSDSIGSPPTNGFRRMSHIMGLSNGGGSLGARFSKKSGFETANNSGFSRIYNPPKPEFFREGGDYRGFDQNAGPVKPGFCQNPGSQNAGFPNNMRNGSVAESSLTLENGTPKSGISENGTPKSGLLARKKRKIDTYNHL